MTISKSHFRFKTYLIASNYLLLILTKEPMHCDLKDELCPCISPLSSLSFPVRTPANHRTLKRFEKHFRASERSVILCIETFPSLKRKPFSQHCPVRIHIKTQIFLLLIAQLSPLAVDS